MSKPGPSCLYSGNAGFIEALYEDYLQNPGSVEKQWREYFTGLQAGTSLIRDTPHSPVRQAFHAAAQKNTGSRQIAGATDTLAHGKQVAVLQLINAYRFRGNHQADLEPLR